MSLVLNSKQFAAYHQRLAADFRPTILRGMRAGGARVVAHLVHLTRTAPPANPNGIGTGGAVNTGAFIRRWRAVPMPDGIAFVNDSPYGPIINDGRRPGSKFPPKAPLIAWIKRRILTKPRQKKRRFGPKLSEEQARAAADQKRLEAAIRRVGAKDRKYGPRREPKPKPPPRRKKGVRRSYTIDEQAARLYFPIARAIARRGLIGRKISNSPNAHRDILDMVTRAVEVEIQKELAKR